jgi:hypothetical protein
LAELEQLYGNVQAIEYDLQTQIATIFLKKPIVFKSFMKKELKIKCDYEKFEQIVSKYL